MLRPPFLLYGLLTLLLGVLLPCAADAAKRKDKSEGIKWLALGKGMPNYWNQTVHCLRAKEAGLSQAQVQMCRQNLDLMRVVSHAALLANSTCQRIFADRRWNCSSVTRVPHLTPDLTSGSREQAIVYALASASLSQAISKACSLGITTKCSCGRLPNDPPPGTFKWGGCGDNVHFGLSFSKIFTDAVFNNGKRMKRSKSALTNLHNNGAGRTIVADSLATACKCHGVSGSCSIKTCWKALPDIMGIGAQLKQKYSVAVEVESKKVRRRRQMVPRSPYKKSYDVDDLIYFTKSPDYCSYDLKFGSQGTRGRFCRKGDMGSGGCDSMCCGRGFTSHMVERRERCECKYYWCCYVKCKWCIRREEVNRCR